MTLFLLFLAVSITVFVAGLIGDILGGRCLALNYALLALLFWAFVAAMVVPVILS